MEKLVLDNKYETEVWVKEEDENNRTYEGEKDE